MFFFLFKSGRFKDREKSLDAFVKQTRDSLNLLIRNEKNPHIKRLYNNMKAELNVSKWKIIPEAKYLAARRTAQGGVAATLGLTTKLYQGSRRICGVGCNAHLYNSQPHKLAGMPHHRKTNR